MQVRNRWLAHMLTTGMWLAVAVAPTVAQAPQQSSAETKPMSLPEVEVQAPYSQAVPSSATTGTKTETPLKDIPASIEVVPQEVLAEQGAHRLFETIIRNVSGVSAIRGGGSSFGDAYNIRGLRTNFSRDGLPENSSNNGYARTGTDVERIEVLKGPGSALYGSGDPGGTINLITKQPLATPLYSIYGSGGSFGTHLEAVDLGGPLGTPQLLYRFNAAYYHTDGFRDQANTTIEILPKLAWKPNPDHTLTLSFDYRNIKVVPDLYGIPFRGPTLLDVPRDTTYFSPFSRVDQELFRVALQHEWRLTDTLAVRNNFVLLRREFFILRHVGGTVAPGSNAQTGRALRQQANEPSDEYLYQVEPVWTLKIGPTRHTLLSGVEFKREYLNVKRSMAALPSIVNVFNPVIREQSITGLVFVPEVDGTAEDNKFSLYVQDQVEFGEQWKARVSVRISRFDTRDFNRLRQPRIQSRSDDVVDVQAGLVYQPVRATSFYTGVARSHASAVNIEAGTAARVPESATQWELGNKSTFLDDRISLNLALFHVTRENFLVNIGGEQVPIGEQRTQGVEFTLASEPVRGWKLYANYAYQDAELVRLAPTDPASGKGNRPTQVPEHSAALWTTYELQTGLLQGLGFGGGMIYKGSVFNDNLNTQSIPAYVVGDLVAFYRRAPFEVQLNVKNVADTTYFVGGANSGALPGDPLAVLATVRVRY